MSLTSSKYDSPVGKREEVENKSLYSFTTDISKYTIKNDDRINVPLDKRIDFESNLRGYNNYLFKDVKRK